SRTARPDRWRGPRVGLQVDHRPIRARPLAPRPAHDASPQSLQGTLVQEQLMFVGHFAVGLAAKRVAPSISLGTLVLAAMLADLLWCLFMIAGIEHVEFRSAMGAGNYFQASDIVWSHSLLMDAVWGTLLAAAYFLRRRSPRGAWILLAAVISHWVLDWIAHRPDMPLAPRARSYFGLG